MKYKILEKDVIYGNKVDEGSFAEIYKGKYNGEDICIKRYFDQCLPDFYDEKRMKILCEMNKGVSSDIILPMYILQKGGKSLGYISRLIENKSNFYSFFSNMSLNDKIKYLTDVKELINKMHSYGIIHGDIHGGNVIFGEYNKPYIIDFDNCSIGDCQIDKHMTSDLVEKYLYYNDIGKDVDVFKFNILTYAVLNNVQSILVRCEINNNNFGIFNTKDAIDICRCAGEVRKTNEYLIDYVRTR